MDVQTCHPHHRWVFLFLPFVLTGWILTARSALSENPLKFTVPSQLQILMARDARAVKTINAAGESLDWIAALKGGGLLTRNGLTGDFQLLAEFDAEALAALRRSGETQEDLVVALAGGGVILLELQGLQVTLLGEMCAIALAAGNIDADGDDEVVLADASGGVFMLDPLDGSTSMISSHDAIGLAIGDYLGFGLDQIAVLLPDGCVLVLNSSFEVEAAVEGAPIHAIDTGIFDQSGADSLIAMLTDGSLLDIDIRKQTTAWLDLGLADVEFIDPFLSFAFSPLLELDFLRGDANNDGDIDISDAVSIVTDLFLGQKALAPCRDALDANDDGAIDITDAVYIIAFQFLGAPPPPPPYPEPGPDPTPDSIPRCSPAQ
jgi:hypothetical protein